MEKYKSKKIAKLIIVGNTSNAKLARLYFDNDTEYEVIAFAVDRQYINDSKFENLPLVAFENIRETYPPTEFFAFVAVGYSKMNSVRESLYIRTKEMGYRLPNYISAKCSYLTEEPMGDNNFILEDNTIQPYVKIGNNNVLWSGNQISHDVQIGDHCFITSQVVISGFTKVNNNCFLGPNSTFRDNIVIASHTLIGAGVVIMKGTEIGDVYLPQRPVKSEKKSREITI